METKIKINEQEFIVKQSFRSLLLFEEITNRSASSIKEGLNDILTLFYCILKASNRITFTYTYDEFIDLLDTNQNCLEEFTKYLSEQAQPQVEDKKKVVKKK